MTLRNRIERLESTDPGSGLEGWNLRIVLGGSNPRTYALHAATGEESTDTDLLRRLQVELRKSGGPITVQVGNTEEHDDTTKQN